MALLILAMAIHTAIGDEVAFHPQHDAFTQNGDNRNLNELRVENSGRKRFSSILVVWIMRLFRPS